MVDFVLESNGKEILRLEDDFFLIRGPGFDFNLGGSLHFGRVVDDAQTTFFPDDFPFARSNDRVNQLEQIFSWFFVIDVYDYNTMRNPDLHRRQTDAWSVVHSGDHVINRLHQVSGNVSDVLTALFQTKVGKMQDFSDHLVDL